MNDRGRLFLIAVLALTLGGFAPAAVAQNRVDTDSHARIVRISHVQGTVEYNGAPAMMNSPVTEGSRLVTGTDGLAEVELEDQSAIRLASETGINFAQLARLSTGEARTRVDLEEGEAEFLIPASSAGRFAVNVRGKNILFKQPGRFRILSTQVTPLEIAVWKGEAGVRDLESGKEVMVKAHETLALNPEDLGQYKVENSVLGDDLDRWSEQRDQDLRSNYVVSNTYNNTVYDQYYQTGGYGSGYIAPYPYPYPYGFYGYSAFGCPYGFDQPFWFGSPGSCWNSGFLFNPFFFSPPVVVFVRPPILPRRPIPIRPPTLPAVAKGGAQNTVARPGFRSFRDQGDSQLSQTARTPSTPPGQHPTRSSVPPPMHTAPPPSLPPHSSPPPPRPPSHSFSGWGTSGGSFSHASAPASHSSGGRR